MKPDHAADTVCPGSGLRGAPKRRFDGGYWRPCSICGRRFLPLYGDVIPKHRKGSGLGGTGRLGSDPASIGGGSEVRFLGVADPSLPEQIDGPDGTDESTHYYGDTCLGGHGELADIEAREAEHIDGYRAP